MSRRFHRCRVALHLLLALCLVIPGIAAPAQAVADELHAVAASRMADATRDSMDHAMSDAKAMPASMDMSMPMAAADMSMQGMPCGEMHMSDATPKSPSESSSASPSKARDCCAPHSCDLSACLGTGCLPELPRIAANVPPTATLIPWRQPRLPAGVIDTPLRPPIA
jgi:hypothetical protein